MSSSIWIGKSMLQCSLSRSKVYMNLYFASKHIDRIALPSSKAFRPEASIRGANMPVPMRQNSGIQGDAQRVSRRGREA
jgi:hypothetical protein